MTEDFDISAEPTPDLKKHYQARADLKRRGSLFQVRLDDDLTNELENFMIKNKMNRSQALKYIITRFFAENKD